MFYPLHAVKPVQPKGRFVLPLALALFFLASCGGGGQSADDNRIFGVAGSQAGGGLAVQAYVSKGPVTGASCLLKDSSGNTLVGPKASSNGMASFGLVNAAGMVYAECTGGSYTDEATGSKVNAVPTMRGVANIAGAMTTVIITPLTELAFRKAGGVSGFAEKLALISKALGLGAISIHGVKPTDANVVAVSNDAPGQYGTLLAALSQYQATNNLATVADLLAALENGIDGAGKLDPVVNYKLRTALNTISTVSADIPVETQIYSPGSSSIGVAQAL